MNVTASEFTAAYRDKADQIFLRPGTSYAWDEIITGAQVRSKNGEPRCLCAVASNTFRGYHRVSKDYAGAKEAFVSYFIVQKCSLLKSLRAVRRRVNLHEFCNQICEDIRSRLANIRPSQLSSYNKIRKPVDLYIEHLVSMAKELEHLRVNLVPKLFLPLDSQILADEGLFTEEELATHGLSRSSTYQEVRTEQMYCSLQDLVTSKSQQLADRHSRSFHPIYFDLIWGNRHRNRGSNLFETMPPTSAKGVCATAQGSS